MQTPYQPTPILGKRVVTITLTEIDNVLSGTIIVDPPIPWEDRRRTKIEWLAKMMADVAFEAGEPLQHLPPPTHTGAPYDFLVDALNRHLDNERRLARILNETSD